MALSFQLFLILTMLFTRLNTAFQCRQPLHRQLPSISSTTSTAHSFVRKSTALAVIQDDSFMTSTAPVPLVLVVALGLFIAAQTLINQQLRGDQGLGAFLRDGSGYSGSAFRPKTQAGTEGSSDPLPWLRLPQIDFVQVAGQEDPGKEDVALFERLEELRIQIQANYEEGNIEQANLIQQELVQLMKENGIEYNSTK